MSRELAKECAPPPPPALHNPFYSPQRATFVCVAGLLNQGLRTAKSSLPMGWVGKGLGCSQMVELCSVI